MIKLLYLFFLFLNITFAKENWEANYHTISKGETLIEIIKEYYPDDAIDSSFKIREAIQRIQKYNKDIHDWKNLEPGIKLFVGHVNPKSFLEFSFKYYPTLKYFSNKISQNKIINSTYFIHEASLDITVNLKNEYSLSAGGSFIPSITLEVDDKNISLPSTLKLRASLSKFIKKQIFISILSSIDSYSFIGFNNDELYSTSNFLDNLDSYKADLVFFKIKVGYLSKNEKSVTSILIGSSVWGRAFFQEGAYIESVSGLLAEAKYTYRLNSWFNVGLDVGYLTISNIFSYSESFAQSFITLNL